MRVAGHGMTWREAAAAHVPDWRSSVDAAIEEVATHCDRIFLLGSSFGGALAFDAASRLPGKISGLIAVNTPLSYRVGGAFQTVGLYVLRCFTPVFPKPGLSAADKQRYATTGSLPAWPISMILESRTFLRQTVRPALRMLTIPLLHIENSNDPYIGKESGSEIDALYGGPIHHVRLTAETHRPFRDQHQTQQIVQEILTFTNNLPK
jgi:carboxylesterase